MWKRFKNRISVGGAVSVLIGGGVWIQQGGLGIPDPIPPFYWLGVGMVGLGVIVGGIGWLRNLPKLETEEGLNAIVPMLEKMDSFLREQAHVVARKRYNKKLYSDLIIKMNVEISGISQEVFERAKSVNNMSDAILLAKQIQPTLIKKYANKATEWDKSVETMAGVLDNRGFGLKKVKSKGKYKHLLEALTECRNSVVDPLLNKYIEEHISDSENLNDLIIVKERFNNS